MKNNEKFPYLVIEKRHNDFIFIDIHLLDIFANFSKENLNYRLLEELDSLMLNFDIDQIKESIMRANIVVNDNDVSNGQLIIKSGKQKLPLMTKEVVSELNLPKLLTEIFGDEQNKRYLNIIYNKLSSIVKEQEKLLAIKESIDLMNFKEFYCLFAKLTYKEQRELYFYIYQNVLNKYKVGILKRKKTGDN
ncbi:MAG: hypothetical protein IJA94_01700 [Bacilli bacterium]|nr:hypothetical protein [Bacilli bacterium]